MMFNAYAPYIQFIAALYLSMCFEQIIEKYFWNKKHSEKLKETTDTIGVFFHFSKDDIQDIEKSIDNKSGKFSKTVRAWAVFGLFFSIIMLYLLGLEQANTIDFLSCIVKSSFNYIAIVILFPIIGLFLYGSRQTRYYIKKIERANTNEIRNYERNIVASIQNDTDNPEYTHILAEAVGTTNGDTVNKSELLQIISEKLRENSKTRIKTIICGNRKTFKNLILPRRKETKL